ncbi:MAG: DUF2807 domain-containing protein [Chthoniobacterales bacterium]
MRNPVIRPFAGFKLLAFGVIALTGGCHMPGLKGNGHAASENRSVTDFALVEAGGVFNIEWTSGPAAVRITTDQNLLQHIQTKIAGKTLHLEWDEQLRPTDGIKVKLASNALNGVQLNGAVRFAAAKLSGPSFTLEGNGATRMALDGAVKELTASLNGASRLDAENLQTQTCEIAISGAGRADVTASEVLKVAISGAGKVTYSGTPKTVAKSISGAGSIKQRP